MRVTSEKLANAYWVCQKCAIKYSQHFKYRVKYIHGSCDICEEASKVTKFENFGYEKNI